jgi:hypothetical protein
LLQFADGTSHAEFIGRHYSVRQSKAGTSQRTPWLKIRWLNWNSFRMTGGLARDLTQNYITSA